MTSESSIAPLPSAMTTLVVRGFGYEIRHVVTVPESSLLDAVTFGSPFTAIRTPVVARCGRQVRSVQEVVVVMQEGTPTTCQPCRMFSGLDRQLPRDDTRQAP